MLRLSCTVDSQYVASDQICSLLASTLSCDKHTFFITSILVIFPWSEVNLFDSLNPHLYLCLMLGTAD